MTRKILALMLCLGLLALAPVSRAREDLSALEGVYLLDASPLGMPLTVYLTIDAQGHFTWTNKPEGGTDKGSGDIGADGGTYVMLYSDSTPDALKTVSFTVEGRSLVFSGRIPYGSSGFSPNADDPDHVLWPVARLMAWPELLGVYGGSHRAEAMGAPVDYAVELTLDYGAAFTLSSRFTVMGEPQEYVQQGLFEAEGGLIALTETEREGQGGRVSDEGIILDVYLSPMAREPVTVSLTRASTASWAGEYLAHKDMSMMGFVADGFLSLDKYGGYSYRAELAEEPGISIEETGRFAVTDGALLLIPDQEGAESQSGTLSGPVAVVKMLVHRDVPMKTELTFYRSDAIGDFSSETDDADGNLYEGALSLRPDGTYALTVSQYGVSVYEEEGSFAYAMGPMGEMLTLSGSSGVRSEGVVSGGSININHNVDEAMNVVGFNYTK